MSVICDFLLSWRSTCQHSRIHQYCSQGLNLRPRPVKAWGFEVKGFKHTTTITIKNLVTRTCVG